MDYLAKAAPSPHFSNMKITGYSNDNPCGCVRDTADQVKWDLNFEHQLDNRASAPWTLRALSDGLLHLKRYPSGESHNSAPQIFSTAK